MDLTELRLNELPHHLDVVVFFIMSFGIAFAGAFAVKALSDAMSRTDRMAAQKATQSLNDNTGSAASAQGQTPSATDAERAPTLRSPERVTVSSDNTAFKKAA